MWMHFNRKATALAITVVLLAGGAAYYAVRASHRADATPADGDVAETAHAFLADWQAGDLDKAARLTTRPAQARKELSDFRDQTGVTSVKLSAAHLDSASVAFRTTAHIDYLGTKATWSYTSHLTVVNDPAEHEPRVSWHSNVIHPDLPDGGGYTLQPFAAQSTPTVTDQHGVPLTSREHPGLEQVLNQLRDRYSASTGEEMKIRLSSAGDSGGGRVIATVRQGKTGRLRTKLDAGVQKAVDRAATKRPGVSVVVIRPSTGDVLAAYTTGTDFDPALEGVQAPGQAFELVTAAALLEHHKVTTRSAVGCPASSTVDGTAFTNPDGRQATDASFAEVFAHTCDTGFARLADRLSGQDLSSEAREVFGLGQDWQTGVTTADGAVPVLDGADKAAAAIGRGEIRLNTLNLASLTATVQSGSFRQPLFVDPKISGKAPALAHRTLPDGVAGDMRALMRAYATATGAKGAAFGGVADQFADSDQPIIGWFTAFQGDLAVAATAPEQAHQPETAESVVRAILDATG
ncbi:hypothetical protein CQW44_33960 [Streptomyces griseofuscus]|uniref:Penicillin-binding protein n=2 Tax=Streptomyces griseofuscus TaxID=146922 RepID=A0A3R8QB62_9ACTN|nr:hypothetical protein CQW44_33960 [Streptomyces griseofuscus]